MDEARLQLIKGILNIQAEMMKRTFIHPPEEWLDADLTMQQLKVLIVLYAGQASMSQLAESLHVTQATVTGIIDRLLAHGLVRRENDPADRRMVVINLTEQGRKMMNRLFEAVQIHMNEILKQLSLVELKTVAQAMNILHSVYKKENDT